MLFSVRRVSNRSILLETDSSRKDKLYKKKRGGKHIGVQYGRCDPLSHCQKAARVTGRGPDSLGYRVQRVLA